MDGLETAMLKTALLFTHLLKRSSWPDLGLLIISLMHLEEPLDV